ncbi:MAG: metal ABC transporter ATP-binding protein [Planctomycetes bacterium]|nr:metal ABC transporter ATP-binding protein [Planctomycetota bacterium]MCB9868465.1 metal ABC transporter ATP-binding protein [Planctomycetota bacterium]
MHGALDRSTRLATAPALGVRGLSVAYHDRPVLWNVQLELYRGSLMAVVGPNGAGKSTLLRAVLGMVPVLAGDIAVFGGTLAEQRRRVAYVPQRSGIDWDFPTTVFEVVRMGTYGRLGWLRRPGAAERERALAALEMVDMVEFAGQQIGALSAGQQQRVLLARAFAQDAELYLMDEPFVGVDAPTEAALVRLLQELRDRGRTLLVVHHDLATVPEYFDSVALLYRRVVACGPVEAAFTEPNIAATYGARRVGGGTC